ncbi:Pyruvate decarboxylase 1 [Exophiala xenobiotica]|nr:Pyruvate decarboxylase 1 [Exophiala xenobiotica]
MGVGELSALNGVAGAYTEQVKLIHIVGTTARELMKKRAMIHHCLGPEPDHTVYEKISHHVRAAHCWLTDPETAPAEIDRVIHKCYEASLPVYIFVPMDMVHEPVSADILLQPAELTPKGDGSSEIQAVQAILDLVYRAQRPIILIDALVARHEAKTQAREFVELTKFPTFAAPMGKGIIDEDKPYFCGIYSGQISRPGTTSAVEDESDLIIDLGPLLSDSNTGGHSRRIPIDKYVAVNPHDVKVADRTYGLTRITSFLDRLNGELDVNKLQNVVPLRFQSPAVIDNESAAITQEWIWNRMSSFLLPNDTVVVESGTAQFGFPDTKLPPNVLYITQVYYGCIGYAVPAILGAFIGQREKGVSGRGILVVGDGSLQLSVQEIGTIIKLGLEDIILIILNNKGFTIERAIHGPERDYNNIAQWEHQLMLSFFGDNDGLKKSHKIRTKTEFDKVVTSRDFLTTKGIQVLEVFMGTFDVPWRLRDQIALIRAGKQTGSV